MSQSDQKTEKPTPRRLQRARDEGQFLVSKELTYAIQISALVLMVTAAGGRGFRWLADSFRVALVHASAMEVTQASVMILMRQYLVLAVAPFMVAGCVLVISGLLMQLLMSQFGLAHKKLAPDPSRLLPISKLMSMPSQNLQAALGAVVALPVVLWLLYMVISKNALTILLLPLGSFKAALSTLAGITMQLGYYGMAFLLGWGVIDFFRQARRRSKDLRMTKQEVRDEWKQNEGSPEVKGRIRQLRRDLLRRRMMSEVKTASVIVVNPTHYAVAIRYNMQGMAAPKVVAKGKNFLALRIRELAQSHLVPIVENKPLARALYGECEVGQEIPFQLYRAVAEVLAYVFRISGGRTNG